MMNTIENPNVSIEYLNELEPLIKENKAKPKDYEILDNYLSFLGVENFILNKLKDNRINSYQEFIHLRKTKSDSAINTLVGVVFGVISTLKKYISGKL